jgi:hypothetical protein
VEGLTRLSGADGDPRESVTHWWVQGELQYNASWHDGLHESVAEVMHRRRRQLLQMARYSRAARPDELLGWGGVGLREFRALYEALAEVIRSENAPSEDE